VQELQWYCNFIATWSEKKHHQQLNRSNSIIIIFHFITLYFSIPNVIPFNYYSQTVALSSSYLPVQGAGWPISPVMLIHSFGNLFTGAPIQSLCRICLWIGIQGDGGTRWQLTLHCIMTIKVPNQIASCSYSWLTSFSKRKHLGFFS